MTGWHTPGFEHPSKIDLTLKNEFLNCLEDLREYCRKQGSPDNAVL